MAPVGGTGFFVSQTEDVLANMPVLQVGQHYFATDTKALYVGTTSGNVFIGPQGVALTSSVTLTSAQLLAINTTPVQLVPAPGAGLYIWPVAYAMEYLFGGTAYSSPAHTNACVITYGNPPATTANEIVVYTWTAATSGIIEATTSCVFQGVCGEGLVTLSIANNAPLMFSAPNAVTGGNGTLKITLTYSILSA